MMIFGMSLLTLAGLIGVSLIVYAYFLLQKGCVTSHGPRYLWLNMAGSVLVFLSLIEEWNLPSFVIEVFWIGITGYGLWKCYFRKGAGEVKSEE
jgi:hypothetical protein